MVTVEAAAAAEAAAESGGGSRWSGPLALSPPPASRAPCTPGTPRTPRVLLAVVAVVAVVAVASPRVARTCGVCLKLLQPRLELCRVERRTGGGARSATRVRCPEELRRALAELAHLQLECAPLVRWQPLQIEPPLVRLWAVYVVRRLRRVAALLVAKDEVDPAVQHLGADRALQRGPQLARELAR